MKENKNTLKEMRRTLNDCLNSLRLLEGKRNTSKEFCMISTMITGN